MSVDRPQGLVEGSGRRGEPRRLDQMISARLDPDLVATLRCNRDQRDTAGNDLPRVIPPGDPGSDLIPSNRLASRARWLGQFTRAALLALLAHAAELSRTGSRRRRMRRRGPASAPPLSLGRPARRTPGRTSRWHRQIKAHRSRIRAQAHGRLH